MIGLLCFVLAVLASPFKSKLRPEAENAVLRHQLIVLGRSSVLWVRSIQSDTGRIGLAKNSSGIRDSRAAISAINRTRSRLLFSLLRNVRQAPSGYFPAFAATLSAANARTLQSCTNLKEQLEQRQPESALALRKLFSLTDDCFDKLFHGPNSYARHPVAS